MNRAVHGDVVVAELLPESEWTAPEKTIRLRDAEESLPEGGELSAEGDEEEQFTADEIAEGRPAKKARKEVTI